MRHVEGVGFRMLGPVEAIVDGRILTLAAGKQRALLAVLLARANEVVSRERLIDELWPEEAPEKAEQSLQMHVSRLRKALGAAATALETHAGGYRLSLEPEALDLTRFSAAVAEAHRLTERHEHARALELLEDALELWRGDPFGDMRLDGLLAGEAARARELKHEAETLRLDAKLALGRHEEAIGELRSLVQREPLRERQRAQLMLALYRAGRRAEALDLYRQTRRLMVDELGIEPGEQLRQLERAILSGDAKLAPPIQEDGQSDGVPQAAASKLWSTRRKAGASSALLAVAALTTVTVLTYAGGGASTPPLGPNAVGMLSAKSGRVNARTAISGRASAIAAGSRTAWVTDAVKGIVREVGLPDGSVLESIPVGADPLGVAVGGGSVWVANAGDRTVSWIDAAAGKVVKTITVGNGPSAIAFGPGSVWVANEADGTVQRIDPDTGNAGSPIAVAASPSGIAVGGGSVWVADRSSGTVVRIAPKSQQVTSRLSVGNEPAGLAFGGGYLWVAAAADGTLTRLDPGSGAVRKVPVGRDPESVAYTRDGVWVADRLGQRLVRVERPTLMAKTIGVGGEPVGLAAGGDSVWVATSGSLQTHRGGTLRLVADRTLSSIDPSSYYPTYVGPAYFLPNWQVADITNDGLVAYRKVEGAAGATVVPDLATAIPQPADGGRTYTFQLRRGIAYSTGRPVRASDFGYAAERQFKAGTPGVQYSFTPLTHLVGAAQCLKQPRSCDLAKGITTDDRQGTVTYHLTRPDPAFLYELALPFGDAMPPGSPGPRSNQPVPATGPYQIARFEPGKRLVLVRNPRFHVWSPDAQPAGYPDRLEWTLGVPPQREVDAVEHGRADVMLERISPSRANELRTRYASLAHAYVFPVTHFFFLNTRAAPFDRLAVRRAFNFALDRARVVRIGSLRSLGRPTCQVLPPNMPGYRPYCPYTAHPNAAGLWDGPDLDRARALIAASGTRGMGVTVWSDPSAGGIRDARYVTRLLTRLGYRAHFEVKPTNEAYFTYVDDSRNKAQIGNWGWIQDYPNPIDFFAPTLTCASFMPSSPGNLNVAEFCNRTISAHIQQAAATQQSDPVEAAQLWARIDREVVDQAAWAPVDSEVEIDLLGPGVGNYQHSPQSGLLIDQLWVK